MISALLFFYFTVFLSARVGMRFAKTNIRTETFLILLLLIWILLKSIT
jgi:hypothetical protein